MNPGLSYREAAVAGANPVRLVILLYEQAMDDLRRAVDAQAKGDIEARTREVNHAIQVIGHLQATLDKEHGGKVAENLERFYEQIRCGLVDAQWKQSVSALEQQIAYLMHVHEAWRTVEQAITPAPTPAEEPGAGLPAPGDWSA